MLKISGTIKPVYQKKFIYGTNSKEELKGSDDTHDHIFGYGGNDHLFGHGGDDILDGGTGADTMLGGNGNDSYVVDNAGDIVFELDNQGIDTVYSSISYSLPAYVENLSLTGTAATNGIGNNLANHLIGNSNDNVLWGNEGNDTLDGGQGNDVLVGGIGADLMRGGAGGDSYWVDDAGDVVIDYKDNWHNRIYASVDYTLPDTVNTLLLVEGSAAVNGTANDTGANCGLHGNSLNNQLTGFSGNDLLDGKAGADTMIGGTGSEWYYVDNAGDVVIEYAGEGDDSVHASISYTLGANVENLSLDGGDIDGTGNDLENRIFEGDGNNVLSGGASADFFVGLGGQDTLIGGAGADTFEFWKVSDSPFWARDEIVDFNAAEGDKIDVQSFESPEAFSYIYGSDFVVGGPSQLRFENGTLEGEITGDGVADFVIALLNVSSLAVSDLIL